MTLVAMGGSLDSLDLESEFLIFMGFIAGGLESVGFEFIVCCFFILNSLMQPGKFWIKSEFSVFFESEAPTIGVRALLLIEIRRLFMLSLFYSRFLSGLGC